MFKLFLSRKRTPNAQWDRHLQVNQFTGHSIPSYSYTPCPSPWEFHSDPNYERQHDINSRRNTLGLQRHNPLQYQKASYRNGEVNQNNFKGPFLPYTIGSMGNVSIPQNYETFPPI